MKSKSLITLWGINVNIFNWINMTIYNDSITSLSFSVFYFDFHKTEFINIFFVSVEECPDSPLKLVKTYPSIFSSTLIVLSDDINFITFFPSPSSQVKESTRLVENEYTFIIWYQLYLMVNWLLFCLK